MNNMVSVIVPVYNVEKYIRETIQSVENQSYADWELLLVEDGSRDGSRAVIEEYIKAGGRENIRLIVQPENGGAARARNRGLQEAREDISPIWTGMICGCRTNWNANSHS